MTEPTPTDEELDRWAALFPGPDNPPAGTIIARLLAYVRHLRGEVGFYREREKHFATVLGVADGGQYRNDWGARTQALVAEVSDLRKQLEAATPKTYLLTQEGIRQWAADELSGYPERPSKATPPEAETHMRQALRSAAEEEARLSDPKRHPFNARLSRSEDCGDCGRRQGEHLS